MPGLATVAPSAITLLFSRCPTITNKAFPPSHGQSRARWQQLEVGRKRRRLPPRNPRTPHSRVDRFAAGRPAVHRHGALEAQQSVMALPHTVAKEPCASGSSYGLREGVTEHATAKSSLKKRVGSSSGNYEL